MAAARKMDELLVSWLGNDSVYDNVLQLIENYRAAEASRTNSELSKLPSTDEEEDSQSSPCGVIPPFYPQSPSGRRRRRTVPRQHDSWEPLPEDAVIVHVDEIICVRDQVKAIYVEVGQDPPLTSPSSIHSEDETAEEILRRKYIVPESFVRITKDVCRFPSFFNMPLYQRILDLWNEEQDSTAPMEVVTFEIFDWYWHKEMEPYDASDRFFRLAKLPPNDYIGRDEFLPFIKALLNDHPGLEFLSTHAEFQEKYAVTVITRIFYSVNKCHSGRITSRQLRRSDLLSAFHQVDEEEDINKVTRYLSYEHFYVLYCRFWELDHDRDYRISREDLLKYGDHSLSHMIVDRIFDAAPRPFEQDSSCDYLTYESFIYFMLSEEDKSNEVSVRYWFTCVDVDGDGKLNNMEMRSFYAVQLHRMQCMGHELVPFEDMLCQMMDMIKPNNPDFFVVEDFLQPECCAVSGALFDALFNLNKYLLFEQRDPFVERQKREDEFECDWDRFACIDYNRLAMEEEAREEEAMEIDWVTVDETEEEAAGQQQQGYKAGGGPVDAPSEAPF
jgi:serine/threonine-protein phosphatase 2A regulatory subunit B''